MESAEEVTPVVMKWLQDRGAQDRWFLHLNYWDPHTPNRVPMAYGEPFADDPLPSWLTEEVWREHLKLVGPHKAQEISMYDDQPPTWFRDAPRQPGRCAPGVTCSA